MNKVKKIIVVTGLIPFIINLIFLYFLPNEIPMHYNIYGKIDRMGSKFEVLIFPMIILLLSFFWIYMIKYHERKTCKCSNEKEKTRYAKNMIVIGQLAVILNIIYIFVNLYFIALAMNLVSNKSMDVFNGFVIGSILIASGVVTKSTKRNALVGIRTKWSLSDDFCWEKTNKFGSKLLIFSGFAVIILFSQESWNKFLVLTVLLVVLVSIVLLYSYYIYKKRNFSQEKPDEENTLQK